MSISSRSGEQSGLIQGTPEAYDDAIELNSLEFGLGWMMDVALHPDYEDNGWIYLHETGPEGAIYLLLEHASGGQIVRLVPE